jgi:hypothetical protein
MDRNELLTALSTVAPVVGSDGLVQFNQKTISTSDGIIGIQYRYETPIMGSVLLPTLISVLSASVVPEVLIDVQDNEVVFKLGRAKYKSALMPLVDFSLPVIKAPSILVDDALRLALSIVARSASMSDRTDISGITIQRSENKLFLYGTDGSVLVRSVVTLPKDAGNVFKQAVILPEKFYTLLLKIGATSLSVSKTGELLGKGEGVSLYGSALSGANSKQFEDLFTNYKQKMTMFPIPKGFVRCISRISLVGGDIQSSFDYVDGRLSMLVQGEGFELRDSVKIDLGADSVKVSTGAKLVLRYLDVAERIGVSEKCIALDGPGLNVLIAVHGVEHD